MAADDQAAHVRLDRSRRRRPPTGRVGCRARAAVAYGVRAAAAGEDLSSRGLAGTSPLHARRDLAAACRTRHRERRAAPGHRLDGPPKSGPRSNTSWGPWSAPSTSATVPVMSAGIRSGVNWMRLWLMPSAPANARTMLVLPRPGTPSSRAWPPEDQADQHAADRLALSHDRGAHALLDRLGDGAEGGSGALGARLARRRSRGPRLAHRDRPSCGVAAAARIGVAAVNLTYR